MRAFYALFIGFTVYAPLFTIYIISSVCIYTVLYFLSLPQSPTILLSIISSVSNYSTFYNFLSPILCYSTFYHSSVHHYSTFHDFLSQLLFCFTSFPHSTILLSITSSVIHYSTLHIFLSQSLICFPTSSFPTPYTVHHYLSTVHDYSIAPFSLTVLSIEILYK